MTQKQFWNDPYLTALETKVTWVQSDCIRLQETIFFAFSGGQESDAGTIGGHPVLEARKSGLEIDYRLADGHGLGAGDPVRVEIDWHRRYRLMRLHFAAELVLEVVYRQFGKVEKIGAHIGVDKARIDFHWPENIASQFPAIIEEAQAIVDRDLEIATGYADQETQRRYWEIEGFARVPCGGTHVRRTAEVGKLSLKRKNIGKGKERIEIHVPQ
ncbi:MAG: alanyl-tRNA editing protein [Alphaproteobacteria bacterium]|nr:alanyl-tRNA editing protein [Alphaproteobacteria bacterium]